MKTEATMIDSMNPNEVRTTETAATEGSMHPSKWIVETNTPRDTFALGEEMGRLANAGEIICLDGDLGVGKTVFTKGFAKGLGITESVCSPTFTIIQEYHEGRLPLYHFDVYRIADPEELYEIGYEEFFFGEGVCLVEWASWWRN